MFGANKGRGDGESLPFAKEHCMDKESSPSTLCAPPKSLSPSILSMDFQASTLIRSTPHKKSDFSPSTLIGSSRLGTN
jgi:hypothetical protein